jgi:hypothetical protein
MEATPNAPEPLALAVFNAAALVQAAARSTITFVAQLDGQQEVNRPGVRGQGDSEGSRTAALMIDDVANTSSREIGVSNIVMPLSPAHIHGAAARRTVRP